MLVKDLMDVDRESLPIVFPEYSIEKATEIGQSITSNVLPVVDQAARFIGVLERSTLAAAERGTVGDLYVSSLNAPLENENALKIKEFFSQRDDELMFVADREGLLLGAVSVNNPAILHLGAVTKFIPAPEIFDAMHDAIIIINAETMIVYTNHAYSKLIGVASWKILGKSMTIVEPTSKCLRVLRGAEPYVNERIRIESVDMEVIATITPIYNGGKKVGAVSVFRSIDETIELSRKVERMEHMNRYLKNELDLKAKLPRAFNSIIGKNGRLAVVLAKANRVATTNVNVLIRGENGTGKEGIANAIHNTSERRKNPMIRVNCAAIPEPLLESELFGYAAGAFTGAQKTGKIGKFELADKGTIFLDEIGDMGLAMQAKLLRVTQEKQIERVGGQGVIDVDVRIISATNKNLEEMVKDGSFREDLYYRLNVFTITLPPLRDRKDDIYLLVDHFTDSIAREKGIEPLYFSKEVMDLFMEYDWKGNIRELQNVVEYVAVVCRGDTVFPDDLPRYLLNYKTGSQSEAKETGAMGEKIKEVEKKAIINALKEHNNNKSAAMRTLGISRRTFYKKLKQYAIE
ncbi:MAG: sigma 54-interacting transcriptional regulator [Pseudomonadota bacterium]|nr:sigma 54-interacting transcriptional regulator [Pseudomonadota bacterium]